MRSWLIVCCVALVSAALGQYKMRKIISSTLLLAGLFIDSSGQVAAQETAQSAHEFSFLSIDEKTPINLGDYAGKAVLIVNTASFCGFTKQYNGLQNLWKKYEAKGLVVIGVPSNDFGAQEPKSEREIKNFCQGAFGVTFPLTQKYRVKGHGAHPFYAWANKATLGKGAPRWNFHKYLIGPDGKLIAWYSSAVKPMSANVITAVETALSK